MADEFPTLEVVEAVCVAWLGVRTWTLWRGATTLEGEVERLVERAYANKRLWSGRPGWLSPLARTATALAQGRVGWVAGRELMLERVRRVARRLTQASARDLVATALLVGALCYAWLSELDVRRAVFFPLGVLAVLLAPSGIPARRRIAERIPAIAERILEALKSRGAPPLKTCSACGHEGLMLIAGEEALGAKLTVLGVTTLSLCERCGSISGRAEHVRAS